MDAVNSNTVNSKYQFLNKILIYPDIFNHDSDCNKTTSRVNTLTNVHVTYLEMKLIEFFAFNGKLPEITVLTSSYFTTVKKGYLQSGSTL